MNDGGIAKEEKPIIIFKIYLLKNIKNNKIYIGQTTLLYKIRMGKTGEGYKNSIYLYNAIKKYKIENFEYETLEICYDQVEANKSEIEFIEKYDSRNPKIGYNLKEGGSAGKHSEETKQKIANKMIGKKASEESRANMSKAQRGLKKPLRTEEAKKQTSESLVKWHAENEHPMQGKYHTPEAKEKISKSSKGRIISPEARKQGGKKRQLPMEKQQEVIDLYLSGMNIREIVKITEVPHPYRILKRHKIPLLNNFKKWEGRKHTDETKQKMSESAEELWAERKLEKGDKNDE